MGQAEVKIHCADMSYELQQDALQVASLASNRYESHLDIARYIKKEFEKRRGGSWNCIVGSCAFHVTHETNGYINFSFGDTEITVFKSA
ncbi:hypothetical protein PO909_018841 [Leuciscus waleckii]